MPDVRIPERKREGLQDNATRKKGNLLLTRVRATAASNAVVRGQRALTRVSNELPFLRVALSWRPSLFPLGDSDIGHNIWGLAWDPLTWGREHFQDRGEG